MLRALRQSESLLFDLGREAAPLRARDLCLLLVASAALYGLCMGAFRLSPDRAVLLVYVAVKVPILIALTTILCLPGYFVLNSVLGLRRDLGIALRAILAGQAALTASLASLAPITLFVYACGVSHRHALLFNAAMFTIATALGQIILLRRYRPLVRANQRHRFMLWTWVTLYAFVGIQLGWMLRPFVGSPNMPVRFLRDEPFSNAYVVVLRLIFG
ncbi:MAG: hypothetical protein ACKVW3_09085 [Phycisphaerales bacterium]